MIGAPNSFTIWSRGTTSEIPLWLTKASREQTTSTLEVATEFISHFQRLMGTTRDYLNPDSNKLAARPILVELQQQALTTPITSEDIGVDQYRQ